MSGLVAAIDRLLQLVPRDAKIIPGHGHVCTYADLQEFRNLLHDTIASVREQINTGKSLSEVQAAGIPKRYDKWSGPIPVAVFLEPIYNELKGGKLKE